MHSVYTPFLSLSAIFSFTVQCFDELYIPRVTVVAFSLLYIVFIRLFCCTNLIDDAKQKINMIKPKDNLENNQKMS